MGADWTWSWGLRWETRGVWSVRAGQAQASEVIRRRSRGAEQPKSQELSSPGDSGRGPCTGHSLRGQGRPQTHRYMGALGRTHKLCSGTHPDKHTRVPTHTHRKHMRDMPACVHTHVHTQASFTPGFSPQKQVLLPTRVLGLPQSIEIDQRPDKKFGEGCIGAPAAARGSEDKQQAPLLARSLAGRGREGASWFLIWGEGRGVSKGRAGRVASVVCPPLR